MDYTSAMFDIVQSEAYKVWFAKLKDRQAIARINARIRRISESGHFGDTKSVGGSVNELRVDCGPGYRIYYLRHGSSMVVLLAGGDKSTQAGDIKRATEIAREWKD